VPDRRASPVGASLSAPSLSRCPVGQTCRRWLPRVRPLSLSLSHRPHLSVVLNLPPTISSLWTRPRPRVLRPCPCARAPFEPRALLTHLSSLICAPCPTLSPSLSFCPREPGSSATARRRPLPVPWPLSHPCPIQCHGELYLTVSCPGHPSVCPLPLCFARSVLTGAIFAQPKTCRCRPEAPSHPRRSPSVPEFALEVRILPMPLFRQVSSLRPRNCSPELAALPQKLSHCGLHSLVPPCQFYAHGWVHRVALNVSDPFPKPQEPHRGQPSRLRRTLAAGPSGAIAPKPAPSH
jgi:hypothetical protein